MPTDVQMQDVWRSTTTERGELCVMMALTTETYKLPALCLDLGRFNSLLREQSYDVIAVSRWRPSAMLDLVKRNGSPDTKYSACGGLCFVLEFRFDGIYSFGYRSIFVFLHFDLKLSIHAHF